MKTFGFYLSLCFFLSTALFAADLTHDEQVQPDNDYAEILETLAPLAEQGDAQAQSVMGLMYDHGHGIEPDAVESVKWYRLAAEQGVPRAQHSIGIKYFQGQGVEQDYDEAVRWWEMSAAAGVADSQFNLGLMHYRGIGVTKDYPKAADMFEAAAIQGHGNAQYSLGIMYAFGQGKEEDYDTALTWFKKAADQDVARAQFNLGVFYENGYGTEKDMNEAWEWFSRAADEGLPEAINKLITLKLEAALPETATDTEEQTDQPQVADQAPVEAEPAPTEDNFDISDWLRQQSAEKYTLQLASLVEEKDIIRFIRQAGLAPPRSGYIPVVVNGIDRHTAIHGLYDSYQQAELAVRGLPAPLRQGKPKPWIRNIGILQDILR